MSALKSNYTLYLDTTRVNWTSQVNGYVAVYLAVLVVAHGHHSIAHKCIRVTISVIKSKKKTMAFQRCTSLYGPQSRMLQPRFEHTLS